MSCQHHQRPVHESFVEPHAVTQPCQAGMPETLTARCGCNTWVTCWQAVWPSAPKGLVPTQPADRRRRRIAGHARDAALCPAQRRWWGPMQACSVQTADEASRAQQCTEHFNRADSTETEALHFIHRAQFHCA